MRSTANFGPEAGTYSVSGFAVLSDPENACSSLRVENASAPSRYAGAVVFALRGNCSFGVKISNIQAAGAIAAVVGNNDFDSDALFAYALLSHLTCSASTQSLRPSLYPFSPVGLEFSAITAHTLMPYFVVTMRSDTAWEFHPRSTLPSRRFS